MSTPPGSGRMLYASHSQLTVNSQLVVSGSVSHDTCRAQWWAGKVDRCDEAAVMPAPGGPPLRAGRRGRSTTRALCPAGTQGTARGLARTDGQSTRDSGADTAGPAAWATTLNRGHRGPSVDGQAVKRSGAQATRLAAASSMWSSM